jgi:exonuclease SbcC
VVGASSSGKSAFIRSLKTIVSNPRSSSFVTHGEKFSSLTLYRDDGTEVLFEKGEGHGRYVVSRGDLREEYTKLGGDVPDAVSSALGILPVETGKQSLNFAGQFDRPYLLDETGSVVARVLGELTNVTKIFDAVREASRRKQNASSLVRTRSEDLARLNLKKQQFVSLRGQLEAVEQAEKLLQTAEDVSSRVARLRRLVLDIDMAESYLEDSSSVEVPDISVVLAARDRLDSYTSLIADWRRR